MVQQENDELAPFDIKIVRCNPNCTFPVLQADMTWDEEVDWGNVLKGKEVRFFFPDPVLSRPPDFQPVVGVKLDGDVTDELIGIQTHSGAGECVAL